MKFSIIIPIYKDRYLKECIDSVLSQTYKEFELILVNDDSPYDLDSIVKQYTDGRIRYYKNKKGYGAYKMVDNWNHCLEFANGDYVICMGDDDKLLPNCLSDYVELMEKYPDLDLYHTRMQYIDENSAIYNIQEDRPNRESVYSMIWHFWKGRNQMIGDWLFKTTVLKEKGGFINLPCAWGSDDLSAFNMAIEKGVANLHMPGFLYRESRFSVSNSKSFVFEKVKARRMTEKWYEEFLMKEPTDSLDKFYKKLLEKRLHSYIMQKIRLELMIDFTHNKKNFFKWIKIGKEYGLSKSFIINTFIYAAKGSLPFIGKNRKKYG